MCRILRAHLGEDRLGVVVVHIPDDIGLIINIHLAQDRRRLLGRKPLDQVGCVLVGNLLDEVGRIFGRKCGQDLLPILGLETKNRAKCLAGADAVDVGLQRPGVAGSGELRQRLPGFRCFLPCFRFAFRFHHYLLRQDGCAVRNT